jgi:hypothetical protein
MKIKNKFILGLDLLQAYNVALNLKHHVLQLGEDEESLWHPRHNHDLPHVTESDKVITAQYELQLHSWRTSWRW